LNLRGAGVNLRGFTLCVRSHTRARSSCG
jgi:hypothetical protein